MNFYCHREQVFHEIGIHAAVFPPGINGAAPEEMGGPTWILAEEHGQFFVDLVMYRFNPVERL